MVADSDDKRRKPLPEMALAAKRRREALGFSRRELAEKVSVRLAPHTVTPSAINEFESGRVARPAFLHELLDVLGLERHGDSVRVSNDGGSSIPPKRKHLASSSGSVLAVDIVPIRRRVAAGMWMDANVPTADVSTVPAVRDDRLEGLEQYALRIEDDSAGRRVQKGDCVVCVPYFGFRRGLTHGDMVHCQRTRAGLVETTIRRLVVTAQSARLESLALDPVLLPPVEVDAQGRYESPDETVEVLGVVVALHRNLLDE